VLNAAWHAIRRNAETSSSRQTREEARAFGQHLPKNLRRIADRLRAGYKFDKPLGITVSKKAGASKKRPLVIAPLPDGIVQRAILDVLNGSASLPAVRAVLATPTSIGGIPGRGVEEAIRLFDDANGKGAKFMAASDISGFFTKIRRSDVVDFVARETHDRAFLSLLEGALTVDLANAKQLDESGDLSLFPTGEDGVAQGCPLSALAGNIVLRDFDRAMNEEGRGITCIRYIDDFIVVGRTERQVQRAMASAAAMLARLGMNIYDPVQQPDKAFIGSIGEPRVFLGYEVVPGAYRPSPLAQQKIIKQMEALLAAGRRSIKKAVSGRALASHELGFAQTLVAVDNILRGWRGSFRATTCRTTFARLDKVVATRLRDFAAFYFQQTRDTDEKKRRTALGVVNLESG
jgi:retron-type reverse transcriptase